MRASILATAVGAVLLSTPAAAAPSGDVRALHQEVVALQLDRALNLTADQARALLPLLQQAQAEVQTLKSQQAAAQPALIAALTQARNEVHDTGVISDTTRQAIKAARGSAFTTFRDDMKAIRQQVLQVLTPDQVTALKTTPLGLRAAGSSASAGRAFPRRSMVVRAFTSSTFLTLVQARAS